MSNKINLQRFVECGLAVAKADSGWLASYQNSAGKTHEIGIFADEQKAMKAGFLWVQGFRFEAILAEYESLMTLQEIAERWSSNPPVIKACIEIAGGVIRNGGHRGVRPIRSPKLTGEKLEAARARMLANRRHKRKGAFSGWQEAEL